MIKGKKRTVLLAKAKKIRFLLLDVDGVLTDGTLWIGEQGQEIKGFSIYDGHGIHLLMKNGFGVGLLSGRASKVVALRAKELGIREVHQGIRNKLALYEKMLQRLGLSDKEVAYMGDDVIDLPILRRAGLSVSVPNGVVEVIRSVQWVTHRRGGEGAVREVTDLLLEAKKKA